MKNFIRSHALLCIILTCVLLLAAIWTPLIIFNVKTAPKENGEVSSVSSDESKDMEKIDDTRIICWGDSIIRGMGMEKTENFPAVLQTLVGDDYSVINAGSSGEKADTIAARQGALEIFVGKDIIFEQGVATVVIGDKVNCGFVFSNGTPIQLNESEAFTSELPTNEVFINGVKYRLSVSSAVKYELTRTDVSEPLTLKKGEKVILSSAKEQEGSYCEIFYVGANGGFGDTAAGYVELYKDMIERHGNNNYLIILPTWTDTYDGILSANFGDKVIDLKSAADILRIMKSMGLTPTDEDMEDINQNLIPTSLSYHNQRHNVHLNRYGYNYMATMVYEKGVKLGYWD